MRARVRWPVPRGRPDVLGGADSIEPDDVKFTFGRLSASLSAPPPLSRTLEKLPYCAAGETDSSLSVHIELARSTEGAPGCARMTGPERIEIEFPRWTAVVDGDEARVTMALEEETDLQLCYSVLASIGVAWTMLKGGLALHASAVRSSAGAAFVFAGRSGAGKSTVAELLADGAPLADDRALLWKAGRGFEVESAPNTHRGAARVSRIFFLARGEATRYRRMGPAAATAELLKHVIMWDAAPPLHRMVLSRVAQLAGAVECFALDCSLDDISLDLLLESRER